MVKIEYNSDLFCKNSLCIWNNYRQLTIFKNPFRHTHKKKNHQQNRILRRILSFMNSVDESGKMIGIDIRIDSMAQISDVSFLSKTTDHILSHSFDAFLLHFKQILSVVKTWKSFILSSLLSPT